jgi:hypothetical protein
MPSCLDIEVTSELSLLNATVYSKTLTTRLANSDPFGGTKLCSVFFLTWPVFFSFLSKCYSPRRFRFLTTYHHHYYVIVLYHFWLILGANRECWSQEHFFLGACKRYGLGPNTFMLLGFWTWSFQIAWDSGQGNILISWRNKQTGRRVYVTKYLSMWYLQFPTYFTSLISNIFLMPIIFNRLQFMFSAK